MTTASTSHERLIDALRTRGSTVVDRGGRVMAQCPAHDDNSPSLSIGPRRDGKGVVVCCHAGCDTASVLQAINFTMADLFDEDTARAVFTPQRDYRYPDGRVVHRKPNKQFPQSGNLKGNSLFHGDAVGDAQTVFVVEGEKDCEAIETLADAVAVSPPQGASTPPDRFDWSPLSGKHAVVIADRDEKGREHAARVAVVLQPVARSVRIVEAAAGKDAADHLAAGHTLDDFVPIELAVAANSTPQRHEEESRAVFPSPGAPLDVSRKLYAAYRTDDGLRTLLSWRGGWQRWDRTHWAELDIAKLRAEVYQVLGDVDYMRPVRKNGEIDHYEQTPWYPNKRKVSDVLEAMAAVGHLSADLDPPAWIANAKVRTDAGQMISCTNGLLDLSTRTVTEHTPALFNAVSVPFDYQPDAAEPTAWHDFLNSVWPDDATSIQLLQEYFGYVLSGRTDMQKLLLLIGPTRSGKGTIARLLADLLGRGHVAGPTLASVGTNFGLAPLLGKPLAIIADARMGSTPAHTVVERLLSITGEDLLTVDRKFREPWSGRLPTRLLILSNELPRFRDASAAIAGRMLILQMHNSFLGREDRSLDQRLTTELPGILNWALEGLDRLTRTGRFTVPASSDDAAQLMMDLASPVAAFVRECCVRERAAMVPRDNLYDAWKRWAEDNGHHAGAKSTFGRDLRAVVPDLRDTQPRIGDSRVRYYERIRLRGYTDNGPTPVPPVPQAETAGVSVSGGTGHLVPAEQAAQDTSVGTGPPVPDDAEKSQVTAGGTGGTGPTPFKAQHRTAETAVSCRYCATPIAGHMRSARARGVCTRCTAKAGER